MLRRRSLLALLGIGVSAFGLAAHIHAAAAATGQTFTPVTSWSISRVDPTAGGAPYCTLARRFDGNTVITFARNTSGEGTVAVDFQQPLFDPNQTYRIGLQAGNGLKREFLTRPATPNALVLRTGQDPQFFNALSNASELGVILDDTRYAFSVPDFGNGTSQLVNCIGAAPQVTAPQPANTASADDGALNDLRTQLNALKQENAGIVAALKQQGTTSAAATGALPATAENRELTDKLAKLESEKNALVENLQNERARQQQEAQDEQTLKQALEDQKSLKSMLESERQQRAALEASLGQKTADAEKRGELRARITALEASNSELKTLRETLESERQKRLEVEKLLQDQKTKAAASLEDQERLRTRVSELEKQNKSLQQTAGQVADMKSQLEDTGARASMEQARREAAEKALQEMQLSSADAAVKMADMQKQLESERAKMADAEQAKEAALTKQHADEIARLNADMAKLRDQQQAAQDMQQKAVAEQARREAAERELGQARMELAQKETQLSQLSSEKADMLTKLDTARADAAKMRVAQDDSAKLKTMSDQLSVLETRNSDLMTQLQTANAQREAAEKASVTTTANDADTNQKIVEIGRKAEADRRELQTVLDAERARREKLEAIMAKGGSDDDRMAEMSRQMQDLQKHNVELEKRLASAPAADTGMADTLKKQLAALKADNEMLAQKLASAADMQKTAPAAGDEAAQVVYSGNDQMAEALAETKSNLASALAERNEYRDLLQRERQDEKQGKKAKGEPVDAGANARIQQLENERADLVRKLEYERARNEQIASGHEAPPPSGDNAADLEKRIASIEAERDSLKKQLSAAQSDVIAARTNMNSGSADGAATAELESLRAQLADARRAAAQSGVDRHGNTRTDPQAAAKIASLEKQLAAAQNDVIAARTNATANTTPNRDVQTLLAENQRLQSQLASSGRDNADMGALQSEIAALRAQNGVLSQEINKRLTAAPTRAAVDNAMAAAEFKTREANALAEQKVSADLQKANTRFAEAEAENVRLAKELAQSRARAQQVAQMRVQEQVQPQPSSAVAQPVIAQPVVAQTASMPTVPAKIATPKMAPIVSADQATPQFVAKPGDKSVPVVYAQTAQISTPVVSAPPAPSAMYQPVSVAPDAARDMGPSGVDIQGYLQRAGIPMVGGFEKVRKVSTPQFGAFRWDTGTVFGTAEQQKLPRGQSFDQAVAAYLSKTRQRCSGTFDQSFDAAQVGKQKDFAVADVACVMPDGTGAGAAMLFFYKDGMFNAIAHEGDITQFDQAMATRDSLARFMKSLL
ncbi:MAG: hypothetical protein H6866_07775 [Rhodospirillales bacterium]|nr:MAG: hypothetical protein H6866_07775 [Rhodospirillales bacterium]